MSNTPGNPKPEPPTSSTPLTTLAEKWARRRDEFRGIIQGGGDRDNFSAYLLTARVSRMCQVSNTRSKPPELTVAEQEDLINSHPDFMGIINTYREDIEPWPADFDYGTSQWGFYIWVSGREGSPAWGRFCSVARDAAHVLRDAPIEYMGPLAADLDASLAGYRKWITAILWAGWTQPGGADCYADMRYLGDGDAVVIKDEPAMVVRAAIPSTVHCAFGGPAAPELASRVMTDDGWHISTIDNVVSASASLADALCRLYEQQGGAHQATGRDSSLRSDHGQTETGKARKINASDPAELQNPVSTGETWLSAKQLAAKHSLNPSTLRGRLKGWREKPENDSGYHEDDNAQSRDTRFLYLERAVMPLLDSMLKRTTNRTSKKK